MTIFSGLTLLFALPYFRKSVLRDAVTKSSEFNVEHYAILVAYPAPFHKYPKLFLCVIGMSQIDLLSFIRTVDPIKVRIGERECNEDELKLLETIIGRVVPLLPVAPDPSSGELEASVDKLFDEGGSGEQAGQGDSTSGGHGVGVQLVDVIAKTDVEDAVQHAEVKGGVMPTFPFVSSSVSTTPERVNIVEAEVDSVVRTFVPIMTSATTIPIADPAAFAKEGLVGSSVFGGDSSSASESHPISGGFFDRTGSDFLVGGIRIVVDPAFLNGM
nr:hypothetical protein [Tanacetum cinerariifolium]